MIVLLFLAVAYGRVGTSQNRGQNQSPNQGQVQGKNQAQSQVQSGTRGGKGREGGAGIVNRCSNSQYDYNCAGLALQTCKFMGRVEEIFSIYGGMRKISCGQPCRPNEFQFWFWPHDLSTTDGNGRSQNKPHPDFHTVGGQCNSEGRLPLVYSKNGHRPIEGPNTPASFKPQTGDAYRMNDLKNQKVPNQFEKIENLQSLCYCSETLPNGSRGNSNGGQSRTGSGGQNGPGGGNLGQNRRPGNRNQNGGSNFGLNIGQTGFGQNAYSSLSSSIGKPINKGGKQVGNPFRQ